MSEQKHTPTPWDSGHDGEIDFIYTDVGSNKTICEMLYMEEWDEVGIGESQANAEFIVQACNAHDQLIEALEKIAEMGYDVDLFPVKEAVKIAKEALAAATPTDEPLKGKDSKNEGV